MSGSSQYGKLYTAVLIQKLYAEGLIRAVVDIGAGEGTYSGLLRSHTPDATWHAVEVWEPYLSAYELNTKYDHVHLSDARQFDWETIAGDVDLVFCGDVLEHMEKQEAEDLMERMLSRAACVLVSIPVVHYPQGEVHGNPYEVHVKDDWSHQEVIATFRDTKTAFIHGSIGVYVMTRNETILPTLRAIHQMAASMVEDKLPDDGIVWA